MLKPVGEGGASENRKEAVVLGCGVRRGQETPRGKTENVASAQGDGSPEDVVPDGTLQQSQREDGDRRKGGIMQKESDG